MDDPDAMKSKDSSSNSNIVSSTSHPDHSPFPYEILEKIVSHVDSNEDRNSTSLVCKDWCNAERWTRTKLFVRSCYQLSAETLALTFPGIKSVRIKGKSRFHDSWELPWDGGGDVYSWVVMFAAVYPCLEELRLHRMTVRDKSLDLLAKSFPRFKALSLSGCDGFTEKGLGAIATHCRNLTELNIQDCVFVYVDGGWLSCFPENFASLEILNFASLDTSLSFDALERLVSRCRSLRVLKVNEGITLDQLGRLLVLAPNVMELGIGSFREDLTPREYMDVESAFNKCKNLQSLSFLTHANRNLPVLYEACAGLTFLDLMASFLQSGYLAKFLDRCPNLRRLWIADSVEDMGLKAIGSSCPLLEELRVLRISHPSKLIRHFGVTEVGLLHVSRGCPKLHHFVYFCQTMTNDAVVTIANNCPNFTHFRLCMKEKRRSDHLTNEPLDKAFAAVVKTCTKLRRLSTSGFITDVTFERIGKYAKNLETLSVGYGSGCSDKGMHFVLEGCLKLRKIEIRNCTFANDAFMSGLEKYDTLGSRWMSDCNVVNKENTRNVNYKNKRWVLVAMKIAMLNVVEVIDDEHDDDDDDDEYEDDGDDYDGDDDDDDDYDDDDEDCRCFEVEPFVNTF